MDRWKSRGGKSQGGEAKKWEEQRREKVRRKKMQVLEKVGKSIQCVFLMICGSGWSKVGSLKRRVRSHLARWEMKNCTPLWREAHFQVKMYKTHHSRTLLEVEMPKKADAVVARSTFPSPKSKKCPFLWREAHFQVKMYKARQLQTTFWRSDVEKVTD